MTWIDSLLSSTEFWEWVEYVAEAIVVIGAVGEFLTEFEYILKGENQKSLRHRTGKLAAIVLIVGLAIELGALVRTNQLSSRTLASLYQEAKGAEDDAVIARKEAVKSDDRAQTAFSAARLAQDRADNAEKQAGTAIERAAVNAKEAARLNKLAQDEALARVKIEEQVALRELTTEQRDKLCPVIRSLPSGVLSSIESALGDFDADQYKDQFVDLFSHCDKAFTPEQILRAIFDQTPQGVLVVIPSRDDTSALPAITLLNGLNSVGIKASGTINDKTTPGKLRLIIGVKPAFK
jgi:hypothetical protein